jgi:hypothetical protein
MKIHLRFLRQCEEIQETLKNDGWNLEWEHDGSLNAGHPHVLDEAAGRYRLQDLGLLTTGAVHIDFVGNRARVPVHGR